jgi:hypothetical protein
MYRNLRPGAPRQLGLRMLFQPAAGGLFLKACEADSWRGLVGAILGDPDYEEDDAETRLVRRLRVAHDAGIQAELIGHSAPRVADRDGINTINVCSDEPFVRSLDRLGLVSLEPGVTH